MSKYERPVVMVNEGMAEGVYAASGDGCYTVTANMHQAPQNGRGDYRIQVDAHHDADHTTEAQVLELTFNQPVTYSSSNGTLESGDGTAVIRIAYHYHNNPIDNIGLGEVVVTSDAGLQLLNASMECKHN